MIQRIFVCTPYIYFSMTAITVILFILGFLFIVKGGDWFVTASSWLAEITGIPKMIVGATIVSVATTLPEFFVSAIAVTSGAEQLGIGNAVGSVVCNTGLVLALSILFLPGSTGKKQFLPKALLMAVSLLLLWILCGDSHLYWYEALVLFACFGVYIYSNLHSVRSLHINLSEKQSRSCPERRELGCNIVKFLVGAACIIGGAHLLVSKAVEIAAWLGVSEGVIGITVIALGTSLPELVTTLTAIVKKEAAMGVGNILGANILNITLILPTCALLSPSGLALESEYLKFFGIIAPRTMVLDLPAAALLFLFLICPTVFYGYRFRRIQGGIMLVSYLLFLVLLCINI